MTHQPSPKAASLHATLLALALILSACAANPSTGLPSGGANDPLATLGKFTLTDLQNADVLAVASADKTAHQCFSYLIPVVQNLATQQNNPGLPVSGAFSGFEAARIAINKGKSLIQGGIPEDLNLACAPLVLDAQNTIIGLAAKVGLTIVPGGALLGSVIPLGVK